VDFAGIDTALRERRGLCLITGSAKDRHALVQHIAAGGGPDVYIARLKAPVYCEEDLVERLLMAFGVVSDGDVQSRERAGVGLEQLVEALRGFLTGLQQINATAVLVLDDAQDLPEPVFECVGLLTDLEHGGTPLLQMVLAGTPKLGALLARDRFAPLAERIVLRQDLALQSSRLLRTRVSMSTAAVVALAASVLAAVLAAWLYQRWRV
jgi:MSHA biogenesis protein MshM